MVSQSKSGMGDVLLAYTLLRADMRSVRKVSDLIVIIFFANAS